MVESVVRIIGMPTWRSVVVTRSTDVVGAGALLLEVRDEVQSVGRAHDDDEDRHDDRDDVDRDAERRDDAERPERTHAAGTTARTESRRSPMLAQNVRSSSTTMTGGMTSRNQPMRSSTVA